MRIIKKIAPLRKALEGPRRKGKAIGFVPTMGALHEGHLSLVRRARRENDVCVVSIFVNPIQFDPREDLKRYPRDLKKDSRLLAGLCDVLFVPDTFQMYPPGFSVFVEVKGLSDVLCGASRKGHFAGVTTVMAKLLNIVAPDRIYFGQKDVQQAAIIQKMISDLNFPVEVSVLPIVREKDGLAMSSRNIHLSPEERREAVVLFQALKSAERMVGAGVRDAARIKSALSDFISRPASARVEYIEIVDRANLVPLKTIEKDVLLLLAVRIGKTRLIDNTVLKVK